MDGQTDRQVDGWIERSSILEFGALDRSAGPGVLDQNRTKHILVLGNTGSCWPHETARRIPAADGRNTVDGWKYQIGKMEKSIFGCFSSVLISLFSIDLI